MMKKLASLFMVGILLTACGTTKQIATSKYNPQFTYTPEQRTQISESSLTAAIIDPVFSDGEDNNLVEPYKSFVRNMADDFEESLNANGFRIKGPYKTRDEMVYTDKLNSDFAIEIEVEILSEQGDFGKKSASFAMQMMCKTCYKLGGTFYHKGRIILTATDPIDGEKFWKKTVDLDRKSVATNGNLTFDGAKGKLTDEAILSDIGIYNPVAKVLESYYADAMTSLSRQIDPREMEQVSKQIKAKRERVGQ
ncbi:hypothetical protein L0P88_11920 [Muricauda sp. SCSIO 64092]|uniref:hypothetical protein n=1 Tax=Allomuricauda sp. SCSIO 64092 TaxID=2908842 RepID=UPI001FF3F53C|nr:hypothetical protein [Muricauda sp. SCSIO 64092]UOY09219.1 hypothetical protein L0P88_11920 [Muricauda sp. SCSIO 64092]